MGTPNFGLDSPPPGSLRGWIFLAPRPAAFAALPAGQGEVPTSTKTRGGVGRVPRGRPHTAPQPEGRRCPAWGAPGGRAASGGGTAFPAPLGPWLRGSARRGTHPRVSGERAPTVGEGPACGCGSPRWVRVQRALIHPRVRARRGGRQVQKSPTPPWVSPLGATRVQNLGPRPRTGTAPGGRHPPRDARPRVRRDGSTPRGASRCPPSSGAARGPLPGSGTPRPRSPGPVFPFPARFQAVAEPGSSSG